MGYGELLADFCPLWGVKKTFQGWIWVLQQAKHTWVGKSPEDRDGPGPLLCSGLEPAAGQGVSERIEMDQSGS